jgi:hypothetical protein
VAPNEVVDRKQSLAAIMPIDTCSVVVTWSLTEYIDIDHPPNDLTRFVVSIERLTGCNITPIVRFKVPVECVPINDCELAEKSVLMGASQPFHVKLCAGDLILASLTKTLADKCNVQCGIPNPAVQGDPTGLTRIMVKLYFK